MAVALGLVVTRADAQGAPVDKKDCKTAARIVEKGKPDKKEERAFSRILQCPAEVGAAGAAAIRSTRTVADTAVLAATWGPFFGVVDAALFAVYLDIISDASASIPARIFAVSAIISAETTGRLSANYDELVERGDDCSLSAIAGAKSTVTAPLPAGHRQTVRSALTAVANNASTPAQLRSAAACALMHLQP